jgi:branched-chain amino acid transport system permease protein
MGNFVISIVSGLALGGTYALLAMGIVFVFRGTGVFNLAHGELLLLGAYLVGTLLAHEVPFAAASVVSVFAIALIGVLIYRFVLSKTTGRPPFIGMVGTFGIATALDGAMNIAYGERQFSLTATWLPSGSLRVAGVGVSWLTVWVAVFAIVLSAAVVVWSRLTDAGVRLRAAGSDPLLASQSGINVRRYYLLAWAMAGGLAAAAGISYGTTVIVNSSLESLGLAALPAVILGGMDSIDGALAGGIVVGLMQGFVTTYWGPQNLDVATYGLLLVALLVKPEGLFGTREIVRV